MMASRSKTAPGRTRVMALDYGRRRIGLAVSDELQLTARPLATLKRINRRSDIRRLREMARAHAVGLIVVGHPLQLDGATGPMTAEVARFAARLAKELGVPVESSDERLSSWEAEQFLREHSTGRRKPDLDQVAAAIILRDYLARTKPRKAHAG